MLALVAAFAAVYLIWGSTYLGIRIAIKTLPAFAMAGSRFLIAGIVLYSFCRWRGVKRPAHKDWVNTTIVGAFLLLGGNGCVVWASQTVPSGIVALLVAVLPMWMVLIEWLRPSGVRPGRGVVIGLVVGFMGVAVLVDPRSHLGSGSVNPAEACVLLLGGLLWALGSIYSRQAKMPSSLLMSISMQMITGGLLLSIVAASRGDYSAFRSESISLYSLGAFAYLVVFGSLIGFSAYVWLLQVTTPARVSTYAYVNPVVALVLGWAIENEPLTNNTLIAGAMIVIAVAFITAAGPGRRVKPQRSIMPVPGIEPETCLAPVVPQSDSPGLPDSKPLECSGA